MEILIHTAEGKLESQDPYTIPGTKIETLSRGELNRLGFRDTSDHWPGLITNRAARMNCKRGTPSTIFVAWHKQDVSSETLPSRVDTNKIRVVDEWSRPRG